MHRHLVTVEVRIIGSANQRMNSNGFALDQLRFKSLDGQSVQSRRTIEEHWMTFGHFIENIPNLRRLTLDHLFRAAHGVHVAKVFKPANDKWFEKHKDRKSTRLNSSHSQISYAVFCLKKKKK